MPRNKAPVTFMLAFTVVVASGILILYSGGNPVDQAPSLTVVAMLSAFVIALCFRQLGSSRTPADRRLLTAALVMAAATLLADVRVATGYRASPVHFIAPSAKSPSSAENPSTDGKSGDSRSR